MIAQASERDISKALVTYLEGLRKQGLISYYVNIEGGRRDVRQQVALKRQGARPGRPDLEILMPDGRAMFVELKRKKGGRLSEHQKREIQDLHELGFDTEVLQALDLNDAVTQMESLLKHRGIIPKF